jgi:flagellar biosynthesis/type III secretory pathway chaperone
MKPGSNPILNELAIANLMDVMAELIKVVEAENHLLHRGLPAALSDLADQKDELTNQFVDISRGVMTSCAQEIADDIDLRDQIVATGETLRSLTQENMRLLRGAMSATRRRIDSVMNAIRAEGGQPNAYGATGSATEANFVEGNVNCKA